MNRMYKKIGIAVCVALFSLLFTIGAAALVGDLNKDGAVGLRDVLALRKYLVGMETPANLAAGDLNGDKQVTTKDLLLLRLKIAAGDSPSTPTNKTLASGTIMKLTTDFTETFSGDVKGDYSSPLNAYLPATTLDVLKGEVTDPETGYTYYLLGCGRRVYTEDAEVYKTSGTLTENTATANGITVSDDATELAFTMSWHIPFSLQLKPQSYPYESQMGDFGPKYDVDSFTATYVELTFSYTTLATGTLDCTNSPLFSSASLKKNSNNTYTLKLNLRKTGGFYGYNVRWDGNRLIFSFRHKTDSSKNTSAKPLAGMTIVVDAGHGGEWSGTYGSIAGLYEKTLTLQFAKKLQSKLTKLGATVVMTRTTDTKVELHDVTALTRQTVPDLFISLHMDGVDAASANGPTAFYYTEYSKALAKSVIDEMDTVYQNHKKTTYRGAKWNPYYVTRISTCPAVLVECGFMTNEAEEALLVKDSFQEELTTAIANGVIVFQKNLA